MVTLAAFCSEGLQDRKRPVCTVQVFVKVRCRSCIRYPFQMQRNQDGYTFRLCRKGIDHHGAYENQAAEAIQVR